MKKFKTALIVDSKPFAMDGKDIYETMENIKALAKHLRKPLTEAEEFNTLKDLVELEHRGEDVNLKIADRPIFVVIKQESILPPLGSFGCSGTLSNK